jgi:hypothetical protein
MKEICSHIYRVRALCTIIQAWPHGQIYMEASKVHFVNLWRMFELGQLHQTMSQISAEHIQARQGPQGHRGDSNPSTEQTPMVDKRNQVFFKFWQLQLENDMFTVSPENCGCHQQGCYECWQSPAELPVMWSSGTGQSHVENSRSPKCSSSDSNRPL